MYNWLVWKWVTETTWFIKIFHMKGKKTKKVNWFILPRFGFLKIVPEILNLVWTGLHYMEGIKNLGYIGVAH